jgi:hypothetical protein
MGIDRKHDIVSIDVDLIAETEKAYLVSDGDVKAWIPKSQCEYCDSVIYLPERLAIDKELL